MDNFILIAICLLAGFVLRYYTILPQSSHKGINIWLLYIALPAVSLKYIPQVTWSGDVLFPMLSTVIVWLGAWVFIRFYAGFRRYGQRTKSSLELACGYGNTSFIGFPLTVAYFGEQYLSIAIICDQVLFLLLSTAGIIAATKGNRLASEKIGWKTLLRKLISFPPFIGCVLALTLPLCIDLRPAGPLLDKLSSTVAPLALFAVGAQLSFKGWKKQRKLLSMALLYKLLAAPALVMLVAILTGTRGANAQISVFEAAMPTFITASVLAEQYNLNAKLVNLIIGVSIIAGFVTTFFWANIVPLIF